MAFAQEAEWQPGRASDQRFGERTEFAQCEECQAAENLPAPLWDYRDKATEILNLVLGIPRCARLNYSPSIYYIYIYTYPDSRSTGHRVEVCRDPADYSFSFRVLSFRIGSCGHGYPNNVWIIHSSGIRKRINKVHLFIFLLFASCNVNSILLFRYRMIARAMKLYLIRDEYIFYFKRSSEESWSW